MATPLADALFWIAAFAIGVAQLVILRSTWRGMQVAAPVRSPLLEWIFAIGPAVVLVVLLYATWQTMHPSAVTGTGVAPLVTGPRT